MKADKTIKMKRLSDKEGWELFHKEALRLRDSTPSQWAYILNQLKAIDPLFYPIHEAILMELFKPLKYNYDALKAYELRLCFLYLAAYREEEEIDADQLIQVWLAERLVKSREEGHYSFLKVLEDRCLVEIVVKEENDFDICKLKIHDVLKDMAVHIAEVDQNTLFHAGQSLKEFPMSASATSVRISLVHNYIKLLPGTFDYMKLEALLLSWNTVEVVPEGFLEKLNMLKVLDLSNTPITFLPKSIHQLKHLLYLLLSNTREKFISCDISQLTGLEELAMWNTLFAFSWELTDGRELKEASLQDVCKLLRLKRLRLTLKSLVEEGMYLKLNSSQILLTLSGLGLGRLSDLKKIVIEECFQLKDLGEEFGRRGCFPRLCKLKLWMLPSLESLCSSIREGSLPMLQNLVIFRCMNVKVLPSSLYYLKSLGQIRGDKEWWNEINWEDEEMKKHLHAKYVEIPDNNNV
ncbi:putative disease resistance protein At1g63350 [Cryptomeria japonica]|uniref:putative disease resistance protein At1g63350 n=1 Tax=Cryptomeria japonica TaxID=3369 RepID=UPI0027DA3E8C|nr:putative disease resistance protein At1g63350 [Cryptomeria japonica]